MKRPLILVSGLKPQEAELVLPFLEQAQRPLYVEGTSRLRGHPRLHDFELQGGEKSIASLDFDGVIRIGNVPTLRYWRDLENSELPVWNFSNVNFGGLPRQTNVAKLSELPEPTFVSWS